MKLSTTPNLLGLFVWVMNNQNQLDFSTLNVQYTKNMVRIRIGELLKLFWVIGRIGKKLHGLRAIKCMVIVRINLWA